MKIYVKVKPCSLRNFLEKIGESDFRAEVKAPAEKGKANDALRKLIAKEFGVSAKDVEIKTSSGRKKVVEIS